MLDYPAIAALAAVAREGSFERAAQALGISPSAVSQRVRGLEDRMGTLLVRRGQPCVPTEAGRLLCGHLDRVRLLEAEISPQFTHSPHDSGVPLTLKLAVNADSLASWFPQAVSGFVRSSQVLLDLIVDDEAHTAERLRSGEVMGAVTSDPEPIQGCRTIQLRRLRYAACASPEFMTRYFPDGVTREALALAPRLRFDEKDKLQDRWASVAFGMDLASPVHWVPTTHGFLNFALAGLAWCMQPVSMVETYLRSGKLVELLPGVQVDVDLYFVFPRVNEGLFRGVIAGMRED